MPKGDFLRHYRIKPLRAVARMLRKKQTTEEATLWKELRGRKLGGLKFLRQHPIGPSVVDFYCHEKGLVVEIDGPIHLGRDNQERDKSRQELLELDGLKVIRFTNVEVKNDLPAVLRQILEA